MQARVTVRTSSLLLSHFLSNTLHLPFSCPYAPSNNDDNGNNNNNNNNGNNNSKNNNNNDNNNGNNNNV